MAANRVETSHMPAFPARIVDTTGAGDCFNAAFIVAHLQGQSLTASSEFAAAAASIAIEARGARGSIPTQNRVIARMKGFAAGASSGDTENLVPDPRDRRGRG
jgi:sugar/nucleoside kinase (ribokinase family)